MSYQDTGIVSNEDMASGTGRSKKKFERPYCPRTPGREGNLPPSLDAAIERLHDLEEAMVSIEEQLEYSAMAHLSEEEFDKWHTRTTAALAHKKEEHGFLTRWISACQQAKAEAPDFPLGGGTELTRTILAMRTAARDIADMYESTRPGRKTGARRKIDKAIRSGNIKDRWNQLIGWRRRIEATITDFIPWARFYALRQPVIDEFKRPSLSVLADIQTELLGIRTHLPHLSIPAQKPHKAT